MNVDDGQDALAEIRSLEAALSRARSKLNAEAAKPTNATNGAPNSTFTLPAQTLSTPHALLLLSDSALPLGSFAFSSGLESYLAHQKVRKQASISSPTIQQAGDYNNPLHPFHRFFHLSIASIAGTSVPYILAAYRFPSTILTLDNDLDASTPCTVARRASVAQGRALLSVWERALRSSNHQGGCELASDALSTFSAAFKTSSKQGNALGPNGHFAPLWALVCKAMGVGIEQAAYVFLFNHAKAVLSAAVRASVMGPYQSQGVLASGWLQGQIAEALEGNWDVRVEDAGQGVPVLDLWVGRHEVLYSRIFNS